MKTCTGCKEKKPSSDFGTKGGKPSLRCKSCVNKRQNEYNHKKGISKTYKGQPREDLAGRRVGLLTVLKDLGTNEKHRRFWLCECDCGTQKEIWHSHLSKEKVKSCGCIKKGSTNALWKGCGEISGNRWNTIARDRGRPSGKDRSFDIAIEQAWDLFVKQERKCALSGVELMFGETNTDEYTASLDRIDNSKGYTLDNVQWIHKDINRMKNVFSQERFIEVCKAVASYA